MLREVLQYWQNRNINILNRVCGELTRLSRSQHTLVNLKIFLTKYLQKIFAIQVLYHFGIHCGPRGCGRRSQLYEHLFYMFWASNYRPTSGHNLVRSDLDSLLNSTPFWCKNHFCSLKTKEVIKYFSYCTLLVKALLHCGIVRPNAITWLW